MVLKPLSKDDVREVKRIVSMRFVAEKFRKPTVKKDVLDENLVSIAKALTGRRLPYVYLIWKNPNPQFKKYLEPTMPILLKQ